MNSEKLTKNLKILAIIMLLIVITYALLMLGAIFMNLVTITGIAIVLAYVLLGPVNILDNLMIKLISKMIKENPTEEAPKTLLHKIAPFIKTRIISIFIVYISFFLIVIFTAFQLIPPAIYQISELAKSIPTYAEETINYINEKFPDIQIPGLSHILETENTNQEEKHLDNEKDSTIAEKTTEEKEPSNNSTLKPAEEPLATLPTAITINIDADALKNNPLTKKLQKELTKRQKPVTKISDEHLKEIVKATASRFQSDITGFVTNNAQNAINNLLMLLAGTLTSIGYTITVLVLSFYFILDGKKLINGINTLVPKEHLTRAKELEIAIHESLFGFLKGQVLLGIATGVFMFFVYIIFDVHYSMFLSLFLAVAEIIPVIGSSLGFIPAIIVILFTDPLKLPIIWLIFLLFQSVKDNIVAPKIVGEIIGLHPVSVIFALWIGYQVAGFFGILFAIPVASVLNVIMSFIIQDRSGEEKETPQN